MSYVPPVKKQIDPYGRLYKAAIDKEAKVKKN